jgi:hypothetical protein
MTVNVLTLSSILLSIKFYFAWVPSLERLEFFVFSVDISMLYLVVIVLKL